MTTDGLSRWQRFNLWCHDHSSASHILVGGAFYGIGVVMAQPLVWTHLIVPGALPWFGWFAVMWFFLGRERRDHEIHSGKTQAALAFNDWDFWNWTGDNKRDFLYPAGAWLIVTLLIVFGPTIWSLFR